MTNAGATLSRILGRVCEKMNGTDVNVLLSCTHVQRDLCFIESIIKSIHRYRELQPLHYLHPMWNPQILNWCFIPKTKMQNFCRLNISHSKSNICTPSSLGEVLKSVLSSSYFNEPTASCWAAKSNSSVPDIPILPSVVLSPLTINPGPDKGLSHGRNLVWSWYRAEKGDLFSCRTSHTIMWK